MYAGFTFLMLWAWPSRFPGSLQIIPLFMVVAWGLLMEALQRYTQFGRSFDLTDELANTLGFLPGWLAWRWFGRGEGGEKPETKIEKISTVHHSQGGCQD